MVRTINIPIDVVNNDTLANIINSLTSQYVNERNARVTNDALVSAWKTAYRLPAEEQPKTTFRIGNPGYAKYTIRCILRDAGVVSAEHSAQTCLDNGSVDCTDVQFALVNALWRAERSGSDEPETDILFSV